MQLCTVMCSTCLYSRRWFARDWLSGASDVCGTIVYTVCWYHVVIVVTGRVRAPSNGGYFRHRMDVRKMPKVSVQTDQLAFYTSKFNALEVVDTFEHYTQK